MPKETFFNISEEKRERLLRSAISEFNACGFVKANIGAIAKAAGVAKGSIYQYFEGKNELFVYCVTWSVDKLLRFAGGRAEYENIDIFDYAAYDIKQRTESIRREKELSSFSLNVFMGKFRAAPQETIDEMLRVSEEFVLQLIKAGKKKGTVRTDVDDNILALFLTGAAMKVKEHILKESAIIDFDMSDSQMEAFGRIGDDLTKLLRDGIGNKRG